MSAAVGSVAPSTKPATLEELYHKACAPPGPRALQEWVFLEAKAKGDLAIAEREMRTLEVYRDQVVYRSWTLVDTAVARELVMAHAPNDIEIGRAYKALSDATEKVSVCARMIEMLSRRSPPQGGPR